jgi:hypothetical protein
VRVVEKFQTLTKIPASTSENCAGEVRLKPLESPGTKLNRDRQYVVRRGKVKFGPPVIE